MTRVARVESPAALWHSANFVKLWTGRTVSTFGSHISGTAIPLAALLVLHASAAQMGVLTALGSLPVLLLGLLAGVWVDRLPRRPLLIVADVGRAALLFAIPLAFALGRLDFALLYVVVFATGALSVLADVGFQAFLPSIVSPEQLVDGNSKLSSSDALAEIGGPSVAGVLVQAISAPVAVLVDAVSFLVSAASLLLIRRQFPHAIELRQREDALREALAGMRLIVREPVLRALAGCMGTFNFFGYFIGTLYVLFAIRDLRLSAAAAGALVGIGGISALAGSLVAARVVRRFGMGRTLIGAFLWHGLVSVLIPLAAGPAPLAFAMMAIPQLLGDGFLTVYFITQSSLQQQLIPSHFLGRATASIRVLESGAGPLGALLAGVLATLTSTRLTLAAGVAGVTLATLWLLFSPLRALDRAPQPQE